MALIRPVLESVPAWDASEGYTFTFSVTGGSQVTGNTIVIRDNEDNTIVYTHSVVSYQLSNTVPANASGLENGTYYNAYLTTTDADGNTSPQSNIIQFYCYSSPEISLSNLPSGNVIPSSEFPFEAVYSQDEGERLNTYTFSLYNSSQIRIATSGTLYASSLTPSYNDSTISFDLTYTFTGLIDNTSYYIKVDGITVNGTSVTTGMVQVIVRYTTPSAFAQLTATNNCDGGYILLQSNVVLTEGRAYPEAIYIDNDAVDVSADGYYVAFDDGYETGENFTLKAWISNVKDGRIITLNSAYGKIDIDAIVTSSNTIIIVVTVNDGYTIQTSAISYNSSYKYCLQLRRIDNIYEAIFTRVV